MPNADGAQVMGLDWQAFLFLRNCYSGLTLGTAAEDIIASGAEAALSDYLTLALMQRWIVGQRAAGELHVKVFTLSRYVCVRYVHSNRTEVS